MDRELLKILDEVIREELFAISDIEGMKEKIAQDVYGEYMKNLEAMRGSEETSRLESSGEIDQEECKFRILQALNDALGTSEPPSAE